MPEKGVSNNPVGKPKGATNKASRPLKQNINEFLSRNFDKIEKDINQLEPYARVQAYEKLLSYVLPKQRHIEANLTIEQKLLSMNDEQLNQIIDQVLNIESHVK